MAALVGFEPTEANAYNSFQDYALMTTCVQRQIKIKNQAIGLSPIGAKEGFKCASYYPRSFLTSILRPTITLILYFAFSYKIILKDFLFGHKRKTRTSPSPLSWGCASRYTNLLIFAILFQSCTVSIEISCTYGIFYMALYSLLDLIFKFENGGCCYFNHSIQNNIRGYYILNRLLKTI